MKLNPNVKLPEFCYGLLNLRYIVTLKSLYLKNNEN